MKKIRLSLIFIIITALLGCSAVGVPYTSDPQEKLVQAYQLMNLQRAIPAERLAKESLSMFIAEGNISGESEAHFVLGVIYKSNQGFERISGEESLDQSILHLSKAQEGYLSINEKIQASKVTFEMAQAYRGKNNQPKYCALYLEALAFYRSNEGNEKSFSFNPKYRSPAELIEAHIDELCSENA